MGKKERKDQEEQEASVDSPKEEQETTPPTNQEAQKDPLQIINQLALVIQEQQKKSKSWRVI